MFFTRILTPALYGTQSFDGLIELKERPEVRQVIGEEAESLAYLFCAMTKITLLSNLDRIGLPYIHDRFSGKWLYITRQQCVDLCNITAANWLEQVPRVPEVRNANPHNLLRILPLLPGKAQEDMTRALMVLGRVCKSCLMDNAPRWR